MHKNHRVYRSLVYLIKKNVGISLGVESLLVN